MSFINISNLHSSLPSDQISLSLFLSFAAADGLLLGAAEGVRLVGVVIMGLVIALVLFIGYYTSTRGGLDPWKCETSCLLGDILAAK